MIENIEILREEMKRQNKGVRFIAEQTGISGVTVQNVRNGCNVTIDSIVAVAKELGYKVALVRDESIEQTVYERKKREKKAKERKKPVPKRKR